MKNLSDDELIKRYRQGHEPALALLIERYIPQVYNFLRRYVGDAKEAEDLTQVTFLKIWQNLKKFNPQKKRFRMRIGRPMPTFRVWLFQIARNAGIDYLRKKKPLAFSSLQQDGKEINPVEEVVDDSESIVEKIDKRELAQEMNGYLDGLSEMNRSVLLLRYNQQLSFSEIASLLGESINTVKSRHRRALILLRKIINAKRKHQK